MNGAAKNVAANDVTVYPWHSLVPFLTTSVAAAQSVADKKSSDDGDQDDKEDAGGGAGGGHGKGGEGRRTNASGGHKPHPRR